MEGLLIEDDRATARNIRDALGRAGVRMTVCLDGKSGLEMATDKVWDVIILDRMLPGGVDGLDILKALRAQGDSTPVLLLSALAALDQRVMGLRAGGDDYLVKPFALDELLARVDALVRRTARSAEAEQLTVGDLRLDLRARKAHRGQQPVLLQPREFRLLEYLVRNQGKVVTRAMLLEAVWDCRFDPQTNVVDARISKLRDKVDKGFAVALIHTVRGIGFMVQAGDEANA